MQILDNIQEPKDDRVAVVGAGPVGTLLALVLSKHGYQVDLYEKRQMNQSTLLSNGRTVNFTVMYRGFQALELVGASEEVYKSGSPLIKRSVHFSDKDVVSPYGDSFTLSIRREAMQKILFTKAGNDPNIQIFKSSNVLGADLAKDNTIEDKKYSQVFGCDGAHSTIRKAFQDLPHFEFQQEPLNLGYIEFIIHQHLARDKFPKDSLHMWPRQGFYLFGLPNEDGSITINLYLPLTGPISFENFQDDSDFATFMRNYFPDTISCITNLETLWSTLKISFLQDFQCYPFAFGNFCLLGDAAHTIQPYQGQGLNLGLEDVFVLNGMIMKWKGDWKKITNSFSIIRKSSIEAAKILTDETLIQYTIDMPDPKKENIRQIISYLCRFYGKTFKTTFQLLAFTPTDYAAALLYSQTEQKIIKDILRLPHYETLIKKQDQCEEISFILLKYLFNYKFERFHYYDSERGWVVKQQEI